MMFRFVKKSQNNKWETKDQICVPLHVYCQRIFGINLGTDGKSHPYKHHIITNLNKPTL